MVLLEQLAASLLILYFCSYSFPQIIHKKENIQASRLWENERERIAFWENCDRYFEEQECTTAGQFFEVINVTHSAIKFKLNEWEGHDPC